MNLFSLSVACHLIVHIKAKLKKKTLNCILSYYIGATGISAICLPNVHNVYLIFAYVNRKLVKILGQNVWWHEKRRDCVLLIHLLLDAI